MVVLTIRDVPDRVRDVLARDAKARGQSLQAYLLGLLQRQAEFDRNIALLAEIEQGDAEGAGEDAPDAADVIRAERGRATGRPIRNRSAGAGGAA